MFIYVIIFVYANILEEYIPSFVLVHNKEVLNIATYADNFTVLYYGPWIEGRNANISSSIKSTYYFSTYCHITCVWGMSEIEQITE